jgi:hypothetical protein
LNSPPLVSGSAITKLEISGFLIASAISLISARVFCGARLWAYLQPASSWYAYLVNWRVNLAVAMSRFHYTSTTVVREIRATHVKHGTLIWCIR